MKKVRHGHTKQHRLGVAARNGGLGLRSMLWLGNNGHCWYCGVYVPRDEMTVDHILPVARGGTQALENISLSCKECNRAKSAMTREEYRTSLGTGKRFWGERGAKVLALCVGVALLVSGMCTNVAAQIVRYHSHEQTMFVSAPVTAPTIAELCAGVGRLAFGIAKARDAGVSLAASFGVAQNNTGDALMVVALYNAPSVTPVIAHQLAEGGCLLARSAVPSQAVSR